MRSGRSRYWKTIASNESGRGPLPDRLEGLPNTLGRRLIGRLVSDAGDLGETEDLGFRGDDGSARLAEGGEG